MKRIARVYFNFILDDDAADADADAVVDITSDVAAENAADDDANVVRDRFTPYKVTSGARKRLYIRAHEATFSPWITFCFPCPFCKMSISRSK